MTEAGRIRFNEDAIHRVSSNGGGVYSRKEKAPSLSDKLSSKDFDLEDEGDEKSGVDERDVKKKQARICFLHEEKRPPIELTSSRSSMAGI